MRPAQRAHARRSERQEDAHRQPDRRGRDRGVAQDALQEQALEQRPRVQGAVDEERGEVDDRERPPPEERRRHERVAARTIRIGKAIAATTPMPSTRNALGSDHCVSWPRMSPKLMPPTASAMTIEPSQSRRPVAVSSRVSGTWRSVAHSARPISGTLTRNATPPRGQVHDEAAHERARGRSAPTSRRPRCRTPGHVPRPRSWR